MTGQLINFGPEPGKAAAIKLIGNAFLICFTAGIRDALLLAKALDTSVNDVSTLFDSWNPATMLPARLKRMTNGDYSKPSWELNMARKDAGLFLQAAKNKEDLALIPGIAAVMDKWIEKGHGAEDWTVIAKDAL
jgi:3-hydroxyisobutyrate dehydrogenase